MGDIVELLVEFRSTTFKLWSSLFDSLLEFLGLLHQLEQLSLKGADRSFGDVDLTYCRCILFLIGSAHEIGFELLVFLLLSDQISFEADTQSYCSFKLTSEIKELTGGFFELLLDYLLAGWKRRNFFGDTFDFEVCLLQ